MILGIDASRCRSGGSINHIIGILNELDPMTFGIEKIHIWTYKKLLLRLPNKSYIVKHENRFLELNLFFQLFWQAFLLKFALKKQNCNYLFTADSSSLCKYKNQVVFSQDLLAYEFNTSKNLGFGYKKLRLHIIRLVQNFAFKNAQGVIFLTKYTSDLIQNNCGILKKSIVIPHGFNHDFLSLNIAPNWDKEIICTYVSNIEFYKHQIEVVKAIELLKFKKYNIKLHLIGDGIGSYYNKLNKMINKLNLNDKFINHFDFLPHNSIIDLLKNSHIIIFASSCETFGITLLENMGSGLPIACSNRSSLPEVLGDGGVYFDPEDPISISNKVEFLINNKVYASELAKKARIIAKDYSWKRCSFETFSFIRDCYIKSIK